MAQTYLQKYIYTGEPIKENFIVGIKRLKPLGASYYGRFYSSEKSNMVNTGSIRCNSKQDEIATRAVLNLMRKIHEIYFSKSSKELASPGTITNKPLNRFIKETLDDRLENLLTTKDKTTSELITTTIKCILDNATCSDVCYVKFLTTNKLI